MPRQSDAERGFTLIELMVVMVIVAVIVAVAVLNPGDRRGNEEVAAEARRLAALVEVARERAELDAVEYGLDVHVDGYRFLQYEETTGEWQPCQRAILRQRALPVGVRMALNVDAQTLPPATGAESRSGSGKVAQPGVLLLSSGEASNFRVTISASDKDTQAWVVGSDGVAVTRAAKAGADR